MYIKCLLLLFVVNCVDCARNPWSYPRNHGLSMSELSMSTPCKLPKFERGRYRFRQKSHVIRFTCLPGYELVGNRYATCRDGEWDEPIPVCVKPGCSLEPLENGVQWKQRKGAWVISFCMPGFKLVGSSVIYCNGRNWNATAPTCVDSTSKTQLSCDFEDENLCDWKQDSFHDFDWKRWNQKTPSSFLNTGPSYDHTLGEGESGHYMYIESTSRLENDTARLISPIYDESLAKNGCFAFFYHMFGRGTGGLRVYQKPDKLQLQQLLQMSDSEMKKYILFEKWGNQGDIWFGNVAKLNDLSDDFQIVIEGIRGKSFTSDIAIDDVAILQDENCTIAEKSTVTTALVYQDTCVGRCDMYGNMSTNIAPNSCYCTIACIMNSDCCPDFFENCVFGTTVSYDASAAVSDLPQTQKLVAGISSTLSASATSTFSTTTSTSTTTTSTTTIAPSTTRSTIVLYNNVTARIPSTTPKITRSNATSVYKPSTRMVTTAATTKRTNKGSSTKILIKPVKITTKATTAFVKTTPVGFSTRKYNDFMKSKKEQDLEVKSVKASAHKVQSSGLKTTVITVTALLCCGGLVWLAAVARSARGREALARLRGRTRRDPEVRYLSADVDDE